MDDAVSIKYSNVETRLLFAPHIKISDYAPESGDICNFHVLR